MKVLDNVEEIFDNAIKGGVLSILEKDDTYIGNFMYMYSDKGVHYFKHKSTRMYGYDNESIKNACCCF